MNFLKNIIASFIGSFFAFLIAGFVLVALLAGVAVALFSDIGEKSKQEVAGTKVLRISLENELVEYKEASPFDDLDLPYFLSSGSQEGLVQLLKSIDKAAEDAEVKAIVLNLSNVMGGYSQVKELRDKLIEYKEKSGKPIIAYSEVLTEKAYYLVTVADKVYVMPEGLIEFNGLSLEMMYYKNLLEKLDITPKIFRVGEFKSAVEPFMRENMSESNRKQLREFSESLYNEVLREIAVSRNIDPSTLRNISDELRVRKVSDAVDLKLIDGAMYQDEVIAQLKTTLAINQEDKITFVSAKEYMKEEKDVNEGKIAVIVAEGEIVSGKSFDAYLGSSSFVSQLKKASEDDEVKAIVIRINSPGGSAMASDVMWRAIKQAANSKPVIASMSSVAASGGYYMAMACDTIVAEPLSITGSIGVFGVLFEIDEFLSKKLGITTDREKTGEFADIGSPTRKMTLADSAIIQAEVNRIYEVFTEKAAQSRSMSVEKLKSYAGGRVWSGIEAKHIGLVDELGGLERAIAIAAEKAGVSASEVKFIGNDKSFLDKLSGDYSSSMEQKMLQEKLGEDYRYIKVFEQLKHMKGVRASLPYDLKID